MLRCPVPDQMLRCSFAEGAGNVRSLDLNSFVVAHWLLQAFTMAIQLLEVNLLAAMQKERTRQRH